jgi:transposase-like protein
MNSREPMPLQREHLRTRIAEVLKQAPRQRRYGRELKRTVVDYAFARQDERATIRAIAEELGLSAGLLGKWLRHAWLRLEKGKLPFEPGEPLPMPWLEPKAPAAEPSAAGAPSTQAEHTRGANRAPTSGSGAGAGQASTPRRIIIPAASLAEFLTGAVASHGSLQRAADGIGVPLRTLRGWLRRRGGDVGEYGDAFLNAVTALRGHLNGAKQHLTALLGDVNAMGRQLDALDYLLGREKDAPGQG